MEKGLDKILYKYEGPWSNDRMGDGPGELLVYVVSGRGRKEGKELEEEESGADGGDGSGVSTQILLHY